MLSQNNSTITARFLDPWPWLALLTAGVAFLSLLTSSASERTLLADYLFSLPPDGQKANTPLFQLQPDAIGALRVDLRANIPSGRWVTYEIQVRDGQGEVVAAALKEAWHESGTWHEGGQSGVWSERDVRGGLDVRSKQPEAVQLSVVVLDYTDTAGQDIDEPVSFSLTIQDGVVDTSYLWPGIVGALLLSLLAFWATTNSGQRAIATFVDDSDPSDRAIFGGANSLIRADIEILGDETSPGEFHVELKICDGKGAVICDQKHPVRATLHKDDGGKLDRATAHLKLFFVVEPLSSYRFAVNVLPDGPIDRTTLKVSRDARTCLPVKVTWLEPA